MAGQSGTRVSGLPMPRDFVFRSVLDLFGRIALIDDRYVDGVQDEVFFDFRCERDGGCHA